MLSLPCEAPEGTTMANIVDDPAQSDEKTWVAWTTNETGDDYIELAPADPVPKPGTGFWFLSLNPVTLRLPAMSTFTTDRSLHLAHNELWNLVGNPLPYTLRYEDLLLDIGCNGQDECNLDDSVVLGI